MQAKVCLHGGGGYPGTSDLKRGGHSAQYWLFM